jgi:hypothetical protein
MITTIVSRFNKVPKAFFVMLQPFPDEHSLDMLCLSDDPFLIGIAGQQSCVIELLDVFSEHHLRHIQDPPRCSGIALTPCREGWVGTG